jgi:hypothetical protein
MFWGHIGSHISSLYRRNAGLLRARIRRHKRCDPLQDWIGLVQSIYFVRDLHFERELGRCKNLRAALDLQFCCLGMMDLQEPCMIFASSSEFNSSSSASGSARCEEPTQHPRLVQHKGKCFQVCLGGRVSRPATTPSRVNGIRRGSDGTRMPNIKSGACCLCLTSTWTSLSWIWFGEA